MIMADGKTILDGESEAGEEVLALALADRALRLRE
jgi:hypothetical protein